MLRAILRTPDGQSGLFFVLFGAAVALGALRYSLGTPAQMGPGFFPFGLGMLLALVGLGILFQAVHSEPDMPPIDWRALAVVIVAIIAAALLLTTAGLLVAIPALVIISSLASRHARPVPVLLSAVALTVMSYLIFILALGLRIPVLGG